MIALLLKRAFATGVWLSRRHRQGAVHLLKIRAAIFYVHGVKAARTVSMRIVLALGLIALMGAGLVILPIGLAAVIYGLGGSPAATGVGLVVLGVLYLTVPLYVGRRCMSEGVWMRFFKVDDIIARVTEKPTTG